MSASSSLIRLDGSEGGGQLVRTALTLSLVTGTPFEVVNVRGGRPVPGLTAGQLACVRAAQAISGATLEGADVGSDRLVFRPGAVRAGSYLLDLGAAASLPLTFQTVAVPLGLAGGVSTMKLLGSTHAAAAPMHHYLTLVWLPMMRELGCDFEIELHSAGFEPEGGGELSATLRPGGPRGGLACRSRGTLRGARVLSTVSNLPFDFACRQSERVLQRLRDNGIYAEAENLPVPAPRSRGSACLVIGAFERGRAGFGFLGSADEDAATAGDRAAAVFVDFIRGGGAVDEHLADQIVVPLAIAAAGLRDAGERPVSRFTTSRISPHLVTNAAVIERFLEVEVALFPGAAGSGEVRVSHREIGLVARLRAETASRQP